MKLMKRIFTLILIVAGFQGKSQDIHFSQYNAQPIFLNPAMSGLNGCDYRVGAIYKSQWSSVSAGNTYRTTSAFGDIAMGKPTRFSNFAGMGMSLYSDQAGDLNYSTNKADLSLAYHIMLNRAATQSLSFGITGGFAHRSLDQSRALFDFDPITGEPLLSSIENIDNDSRFWGDVGAGVVYSVSPNRRSNYFFGVAIHHFNQPNISNFTINRLESERMHMKFTLHGGTLIPLSSQLSILPGYMVLIQGPHHEINITNFFKFNTSTLPNKGTAFYFGTMYRVADAVILATRADFQNGLSIHFSYDLNISKLSSASRLNGGPEAAIVYTGCIKRKNKEGRYCPQGL
jgi:type IX secretion system PorP/SprF family membrane protein